MFSWNADKIRFLRDASEFTPFNEALARRAAGCFPQNAHVCDAGCGLGYLSLALSALCPRVTAVDTSREALCVLRENMEKNGVRNIAVWEADAFALPQQAAFDCMTFCFFGDTDAVLRCVKAHCRSTAVLFKKNWTTRRFTARETPLTRFTFRQTCEELSALGIPFESDSFELDMGQPFRSLAEAEAFFRLHDRQDGGPPLSKAELRARLTETESVEFPYYLPSGRSVGMIVLEKENIPDSIQ